MKYIKTYEIYSSSDIEKIYNIKIGKIYTLKLLKIDVVAKLTRIDGGWVEFDGFIINVSDKHKYYKKGDRWDRNLYIPNEIKKMSEPTEEELKEYELLKNMSLYNL